IGQELVPFGGIASGATVDQVPLHEAQLRSVPDGLEVVDLEDAEVRLPPFPSQAVDAAEAEIVAEPGAKAFAVQIANGTVPSDQRSCRISKRGHGFACAAFRSSSSSSRRVSARGSGVTSRR